MSNVFELLASSSFASDVFTAIGRLLGGSSPVATSPKARSPTTPRASAGDGTPPVAGRRRREPVSPVRRDWEAELPLTPTGPPPPLPPRAPGWDFTQLLPADKRQGVRAAAGGLNLSALLGGAMLRSTDSTLSAMARQPR